MELHYKNEVQLTSKQSSATKRILGFDDKSSEIRVSFCLLSEVLYCSFDSRANPQQPLAFVGTGQNKKSKETRKKKREPGTL